MKDLNLSLNSQRQNWKILKSLTIIKMRTEKKEKKVFMKPGKDNQEDRMNFVKYWANYVKTHDDAEWSEQQNILINSQIG